MRTFSLNPVSLFTALDFFGRVYFAGLVLLTGWGGVLLVRIARATKFCSVSQGTNELAVEGSKLSLDSVFCLAVILAAACFADEILFVCRIYMVDRFTDVSPAYALNLAWSVTHYAATMLVLLQVARWMVSRVLRSGRTA